MKFHENCPPRNEELVAPLAGDKKVTERLITRHALTNTVFDRLLNAKATRREDAQAGAASLRDFRLT